MAHTFQQTNQTTTRASQLTLGFRLWDQSVGNTAARSLVRRNVLFMLLMTRVLSALLQTLLDTTRKLVRFLGSFDQSLTLTRAFASRSPFPIA